MTRTAALEAVLGAIQERWGIHSLTRGYNGARGSGSKASGVHGAEIASALPPWWPGAEGYLRPGIFELSGPASCGKLGVALLWLAAASRGGLVAVVDLDGTFYPPSAAAAGLDLERLVFVRPPDRRGAVEAVSLLLGSAGFDAILWPLEWKTRPLSLDSVRFSTLAARSNTTLLALVTDHRRLRSPGAVTGRPVTAGHGRIVTSADGLGTEEYAVAGMRRRGHRSRGGHELTGGDSARLFPSADLRLRVTGWEWVWRDGELAGVRPRLRTERMRGALAGQVWELRMEHHAPADSGAGGEASARAAYRVGAGADRPVDGIAAAGGNAAGRLAGAGAAGRPEDDRAGDGDRPGRCPPTDHLCLAAAIPLGDRGARAAGSPGAADRGVRSESAAAPAARTA